MKLPLALIVTAAMLPFVAVQTDRVAGAAVPSLAVPVDARVTERLRTNGLTVADPQLREKLAALAKARRRPAASGAPVLSAVARARLATRPSPTHPRTLSRIAAGTKPPAPVIDDIEWSAGSAYLDGSNLIDASSPASTSVAIDMGACGSSKTGLQPGSYDSFVFFAPPAYINATTAKVTLSVDGVASNTKSVPLPVLTMGDLPVYQVTGSIADAAPFFSSPAGMPSTAYATTTQADHVSTNPAGAPSQGDDTVGYGVKVLNGWTVTAAIANVHSYQDASGNSGANDDYRSATITQQPQSGRLETKVHWKYEAGESLSYDVIWTFSAGPFYARYIDTIPKKTACPEEQ